MRVTFDRIDEELRLAGRLAKLVFRPSVGLWKFMHKQGKRTDGQNIKGLTCEQRWIASTDDAQVRVRVYRPSSAPTQGPLPGVLFLHGGGYAIGNPESSGPTIQTLMETRDCVVVAPDYRKSFDAPYPAAADDCYSTLLWLKQNAAELGVREDQLIVVGQSAGGGLAAAVALMARDRDEVRIAYQLPLYPMIDDRMTTESSQGNDAPLWSSRHNRLAWDLYLGGLAGSDVPKYAAAARETDYAGLPPTSTFVGELDPFRDETAQYVENLRAAGVEVEFRIFKGCYHGFDVIRPGARVSQDANGFLCERLSHAVDHCFAKQP